jgi:uncharacterized SAM-binding protein YcdF (DUF218 family)
MWFSALTSLGPNILLWMWLSLALVIWRISNKNRSRCGWGFLVLAAIWLLSTRPAAEIVLWPLESRYKPPDVQSLQEHGARQIVVLTGGGYSIQGEMLSSGLPHASIYRFVGGLELCARLGPKCKIVFSGSAGRSGRDLTTALTMQELCLLLRPGSEVLAEARSGSTAEHPGNVRPLVKSEPFVLVTSAIHMPRTMRSFRRAGLDPIPYPVDFLAVTGPYGWSSWIPSVENLWSIGVALREYMALVLYTVKGW